MAESKERAFELRKAHFSLGHEPVRSVTTYLQSYIQHQPVQNSEKKIDNRSLRACHFTLGTDQPQKDTSYTSAYSAKKAECVSLNKSVLSDIRATHYELGHNPRDFTSIHKESYKPIDTKNARTENVARAKQKERPKNSVFGDVNRTYVWEEKVKAKELSKSFVQPA